jgi:hypothetical protein
MTNRITIVAFALALITAGAALASGQKDAPVAATQQSITVTGAISYLSTMHPLLKSGDSVYELFVPRYLVVEAGVKEGATVSVEGYRVDAPSVGSTDDGNIDLFVTKATINGTQYDLSRNDGYGMMGDYASRGSRGMMGGHGMMGGYAAGGGYARGYRF